jgi:hypothetical protein
MTDTMQDIRRTVLRLMAYTRGRSIRTAEDLSSWRAPGRFDFLISDLVTAAGGRSSLPEEQAKSISQKLGYTWDDSIRGSIETALAQYGVSLSNEKYQNPDYSTPSREKLLKGSLNVRRLKGRSW